MRALPNELLLGIFEQLTYFDLLRARSACKRFQSIISAAPTLSTTLFREIINSPTSTTTTDELGPCTPEGASRWWVLCGRIVFPRVPLGNGLSFRAPPKSEVEKFEGELHPAFEELEYGLGEDMEDVYFLLPPIDAPITTSKGTTGVQSSNDKPQNEKVEENQEEEERKLELLDTPVAHENAITPAVSKLVLHVGWYPEFWIVASSPSSAVSVEDVMRGVIAAYNTLVSESDWQKVRDDGFDDGWSSDEEETPAEREKKEEEVKRSMLGRPRKEFLGRREQYGFHGVQEGMFIDGVLHLFVPHEWGRKKRRKVEVEVEDED